MDEAVNPYAPGAGTPPPVMTGRDDLVAIARVALVRAKAGRSAKSFVAVGLRGVGKTVVLNRILDLAEAEGFQTIQIEADEDKPLVELLIPQIKRVLFRLDRIDGAQEVVRRGLRVLKSFVSSAKLKYGEFEAGLDLNAEQGSADSGDLATDLPDLMLAVGEAAKAKSTAVAIFIDEVQYLTQAELRSLIGGLHRINQRQLPIVLIAAGLPQVIARMGEAKSYAERLLSFPRVDALGEPEARAALVEPARAADVEFDEEAVSEIVRVTRGYPYFLQEWGYVIWNTAAHTPITIADVAAAAFETRRRLDQSFFRVRIDRMTPSEKRYIRAMASLGEGPHRSGDIALQYGAKVSKVAPIRSSLIGKGMIYSPAHGDTAFTVPLFDDFIRREMPGPD